MLQRLKEAEEERQRTLELLVQTDRYHRAPAPRLRPSATTGENLQRCEKFFISQALQATGGKKGKAAELLGISRKHLWEKMRQYGLERE